MHIAPEPTSSSSLQIALDQRPVGGLQILVVVICMMVGLAEGADLAVLGLVAPKIAKEWSIATGSFGPVFSSGSLGLLLGGLLFGFVGDRFGRKRALSWACLIMTLGTVGTSFASSLNELLIGRLISGLGFGGVIPASTALVTELMPSRRKAGAICLVIVSGSLGVLLCSIVSRAMAGSDWRVMLWLVAAACLVATLLVIFALPESPSYLLLRERTRQAGFEVLKRMGIRTDSIEIAPVTSSAKSYHSLTIKESFAALFSGSRAVGTSLIWIQMFGISSIIAFMTNWLPLIMAHGGDHDTTTFGAVTTHISTSILAGFLFPLVLGRWLSAERFIVFVLAGAAAAVGLIAYATATDNAGLLTVGLLAEGFFVSGSFYLVYAPMNQYYSTDVRTFGSGAASAFGRIGNFGSPLVAGALITAGLSISQVFALFTIPLIMASIAALLFAVHLRNKKAATESHATSPMVASS